MVIIIELAAIGHFICSIEHIRCPECMAAWEEADLKENIFSHS